jgi:ADP-heptose:LPS heptosyltransferase
VDDLIDMPRAAIVHHQAAKHAAAEALYRTVLGVSPIEDLSPYLTDFAETAALIAAVDLVLTVDTAVAHVAGAIGKRTWLILPHAPDWRWLLGGDDTNWYASLRLIRQPAVGVP